MISDYLSGIFFFDKETFIWGPLPNSGLVDYPFNRQCPRMMYAPGRVPVRGNDHATQQKNP